MKTLPCSLVGIALLGALLFPSLTHARLGDDEAALKKRFGEGTVIPPDQRPSTDLGLWKVFDTVLVFEKSGITITAGLANGVCEAIVYEAPQPKAKTQPEASDKPIESLSWTDLMTLLSRNAGTDGWQPSYGNTFESWQRLDKTAFARIEGMRTNSQVGEGRRLLITSSTIFSSWDDFRSGTFSAKFLQDQSSPNLKDF
ncbi:MAG: hypothetical protein KDM63_15110 [Verrucomicrobiae bacterium]|nr:hypothetical protein [Verrucomicrobiae bacterium]